MGGAFLTHPLLRHVRRRAVDRPQADRRLPPAHLDLPDGTEIARWMQERRTRRLGEENRPGERLRQALDARSGVHGVPVDGVLEPPERADVPGHERPAVEADTHAYPFAEPVRAQPLVEARETH